MVKMLKSLIDGCELRREIPVPSAPSKHFVRLPPWDLERLAPFNDAERDAIYRNKLVLRFVARLHYVRCPHTIGRLVVSVVVLTFNGVFPRWPRPHVFIEIQKFLPSLANFNAASSISRKFRIVGVVASLMHLTPSFVFRAKAQIMRSRVGIALQQSSRCFGGKTSTTQCRFADIGGSRNGCLSAIAFAKPHHVARLFDLNAGNYKQPPKSAALNIQGFRHVFLSRWFQHQSSIAVHVG